MISVLLSLLICGIPVGIYAAEKEEAVAPEDKISEELYQEFARLEAEGKDLSKEKIPVWVWYKDIDQKQVDREVEEQTGLTEENISVDFEMPSHSLIEALKQEKTNSKIKWINICRILR
jgi:hypothetical protein